MERSQDRKLPRSEFDSEVFGFRIARFSVETEEDVGVIARALEDGLAGVFVHTRRLDLLGPICNVGAVGCIDYCYDMKKKRYVPIDTYAAVVKTVQPEEVFALAETAFEYTRFFRDQMTKPKATALYRKWVVNACREGRIIACHADGVLLGFLIYTKREKTLRCDLIAVNAEKRSNRVGETLMCAMESMASDGMELWVKTSVDNRGALRFYERLGYEPVIVEVAINVWNRRLLPLTGRTETMPVVQGLSTKRKP